MITSRPPPKVLFIYNGLPSDGHLKHLTDAGLLVTDTSADAALATAIAAPPDIIVLDFSADGEITAQLKGHDTTKLIPIIALAELSDKRR